MHDDNVLNKHQHKLGAQVSSDILAPNSLKQELSRHINSS